MNDVQTDKRFWFMTGCVLYLVKATQHVIYFGLW